ncbi:uncharacterized protein LOC112055400 [Bicyclus anynana]|uniref:Uncharacterized protein LOC112055400 n=1 Tax=Bicyclus anynana TaxID=110368 RepID=A0A6J1P1R8_BICAN|nr:uncharacterized protein LOC112055400 [Bicyclus anynana]
MLPSMPILFTRDSQDAFGNKIVPSTSYLNQNSETNTIVQSQAPISKTEDKPLDEKQNNAYSKTDINKKGELSKLKTEDNLKEAALVRSYYTKIQTRFASHSASPTNNFVQFREILRTFDPMKETPVDLYKKVEELFGATHKDIVEEFLLFLKPCQAASVGRFMDHFLLSQMNVFIELLHTSLGRKPTVLRKVIRAMTTGINSGNSADMKSRVLPHLRSNPRLTQIFKTLFPDERPPDSVYETGTDVLDESFLECDKGYDVWEFEDKDDTKKTDAKVLDSEYLHGRVFLQHGRLLRTACVNYPFSKEPYRSHARRLAPDHCLSPPESDSEHASPKRNIKSACKVPQKRSRKQLKSPTKNVKDVNGNTKKECITIPLNNAKVKAKYQKTKIKKEEITQKKKESINKNACVKKDYEHKVKQNKVEINDLKLKQVKEEVPKIENKSWTRDEDKTMLEVLKGEPGSELVFIRIRELLPHRTTKEIKERLCHVMSLLQQMAVSEVT